MNNRKYNKNRKQSRLERIERKCDIILSELAIISKGISTRSRSVDDAIERMHRNARRMRAEAVRDSQILHKLFNPNR